MSDDEEIVCSNCYIYIYVDKNTSNLQIITRRSFKYFSEEINNNNYVLSFTF